MLERQRYPDLRLYPGGPPKPPYDIAGHTLGMLMGVDVDQIEQPFDASFDTVTNAAPPLTAIPPPPKWAYLLDPQSNAAFIAVARLQAARCRCSVRRRRSSQADETCRWHMDRAASPDALRILKDVAPLTACASSARTARRQSTRIA
jgi:hypothetical protein